jgi:hypothetical protein
LFLAVVVRCLHPHVLVMVPERRVSGGEDSPAASAPDYKGSLRAGACMLNEPTAF